MDVAASFQVDSWFGWVPYSFFAHGLTVQHYVRCFCFPSRLPVESLRANLSTRSICNVYREASMYVYDMTSLITINRVRHVELTRSVCFNERMLCKICVPLCILFPKLGGVGIWPKIWVYVNMMYLYKLWRFHKVSHRLSHSLFLPTCKEKQTVTNYMWPF